MSETRMYAFIEGRGEGCDHTVGCNQKLVQLDAKTNEEAVWEALEKAAPDGWSEYSDERIAKITVLRVIEEIDCAPKIAELRAKREAAKRAGGSVSGEKRPRCAVCDAPVRLFSLGTEPSETRAFAIVFSIVFTLFVECHGQTWKQAIGHGQPLPAVLFARMNPEEERQAISEASAILCGDLIEITDHWGNTIRLQHVTSEEEAMRIFLTRSPT